MCKNDTGYWTTNTTCKQHMIQPTMYKTKTVCCVQPTLSVNDSVPNLPCVHLTLCTRVNNAELQPTMSTIGPVYNWQFVQPTLCKANTTYNLKSHCTQQTMCLYK